MCAEGYRGGAAGIGEEEDVAIVGEVVDKQEVIAWGRDSDGGGDADFIHHAGGPGGEIIFFFVGCGEIDDAVGVVFPDMGHCEPDGDTALEEVV